MHRHVRRNLLLSTIAALPIMAGCKDKRIKAVNTGITRDSLLTVIGKDAPGIDSLPNVYRTERYLIDGHNYEVFFFSPTGKHNYMPAPGVRDTAPWPDLTPIAMVDRVVMGKGWEYLDSLYT
ncbi:MAG: hypothetical protein H0W68_14710, partial [Gemmatimonadaceae bacterium]|nr:hypothetical protein [Gemmatimonadaceae bacterium]